jgi:hypothetical protein
MDKKLVIILTIAIAAIVIVSGLTFLMGAKAGSAPTHTKALQATRGDQQVSLQWAAPSNVPEWTICQVGRVWRIPS